MKEIIGVGIVNPMLFLSPAQRQWMTRWNRVLNPLFMNLAPEFDYSNKRKSPKLKRWAIKFGNYTYYSRKQHLTKD